MTFSETVHRVGNSLQLLAILFLVSHFVLAGDSTVSKSPEQDGAAKLVTA